MQDIINGTHNLKMELDSKSITIKQLAEENTLLCARLAQAQREAEELIKFTKDYLEPDNIKPQR